MSTGKALQHLYRFVLFADEDGGDTETLALLWARDDEQAMLKGERLLNVTDAPAEAWNRGWGQCKSAFFSVEQVTSQDRITNALGDITALQSLGEQTLDDLAVALAWSVGKKKKA